MRRIKLLLAGLLCVLTSAAAGMDADWERAKEEHNVSVDTALLPGSKFVAFRAQTHIKASVADILAVLLDHASYPEWYANCKSTEVLAWGEGNSAMVHITIKTPFPLANRDAVNHVAVEARSDGTLVRMESLPDYIAPVKGLVRMSVASGSWWLQPEADGTRVVHTYHADPKARVPAWMVNRFVIDGPIDSLTKLRARVET